MHYKAFLKCIFIFLILNISSNELNAQKLHAPTVYTYPNRTSFYARVAKAFLRFLDKKAIIRAFKKNKFDTQSAAIPKKYFHEFNVDTVLIAGRRVYSVSPKCNKSGKYILYIHGGAYIHGFYKPQWDLIGELVRKTNSTVIAPDYPLAPSNTVEDAFPMVEQVYKNLLSKAKADSIIVMGDSAGGGFALALAEKAKQDGIAVPKQIILISPWLDVTTSNPEMKELERKYPILGIEGLQLAGKAYAGKMGTQNFMVSPIYGDLDGIGTISIFIGGDDIFITDVKKFKTIMDLRDNPINYFEYPKMFHVWVAATFLKESKSAIRQIAALVAQP